MEPGGEIGLEFFCPVAGGILTIFMLAAPLRDVFHAVQVGDMGDLNPLPWCLMLGNCYGWVTYSVLTSNYYLFIANMPGFCMSVWLNLQAVKLQYQAKNIQNEELRSPLLSSPMTPPVAMDDNNRVTGTGDNNHATVDGWFTDFARNISNALAQRTISTPPPISQGICVLAVVLVWAAITCVITVRHCFSQDTRQLILGLAVNLNLIFFYGAPLSTIWTVLSTRSSSSIHESTMLMNTVNACFWFAYGFVVWDLSILIPHGLGAMSGVVQMCLCLTFPVASKDSDSSSNESTPKDKWNAEETLSTVSYKILD